MFAPANFGSDLARFGQSGLHRLRTTFNIGLNEDVDTDPFEVGEKILQALEPASPDQWKLSNIDLHEETYFSPNDLSGKICFPFVFAGGNFQQKFLRIFNGFGNKFGGQVIERFLPNAFKPGTDGTVRICGTSLNTRKCILRLFANQKIRFEWVEEKKFANIPWVAFHEYNHGEIIKKALTLESKKKGNVEVINLLKKAKQVSNLEQYRELGQEFSQITQENYQNAEAKFNQGDRNYEKRQDKFQQLFFKVQDDAGFPINDYFIDFFVCHKDGKIDEQLTLECDEKFDNDSSWHVHSLDHSCRTLMLNYDRLHEFCQKLDTQEAILMMSITAKGPSGEIFFPRYDCAIFGRAIQNSRINKHVKFDDHNNGFIHFLHPNTTTLVEIILDRQQAKSILSIR